MTPFYIGGRGSSLKLFSIMNRLFVVDHILLLTRLSTGSSKPFTSTDRGALNEIKIVLENARERISHIRGLQAFLLAPSLRSAVR